MSTSEVEMENTDTSSESLGAGEIILSLSLVGHNYLTINNKCAILAYVQSSLIYTYAVTAE